MVTIPFITDVYSQEPNRVRKSGAYPCSENGTRFMYEKKSKDTTLPRVSVKNQFKTGNKADELFFCQGNYINKTYSFQLGYYSMSDVTKCYDFICNEGKTPVLLVDKIKYAHRNATFTPFTKGKTSNVTHIPLDAWSQKYEMIAFKTGDKYMGVVYYDLCDQMIHYPGCKTAPVGSELMYMKGPNSGGNLVCASRTGCNQPQ
jgi:hypothetical protein